MAAAAPAAADDGDDSMVALTWEDQEAEKMIVFLVGTQDATKFMKTCNEREDLFGEPGSECRRRRQHRRRYLKANPLICFKLFKKYHPHNMHLFTLNIGLPSQQRPPLSTPRQRTPRQTSSNSSRRGQSQSSQRSSSSTAEPDLVTPSPSLPNPRKLDYAPTMTEENHNNMFQLYLDAPEKNPEGVLVVRRQEVNVGAALVGQLSIYMAQFDLNSAGKIKASLSQTDGRYLIVVKDAQPECIVGDVNYLHHFTSINDEDDNVAALEVQETKISDLKRTGGWSKEFRYTFPGDISCNSDMFNPNKKNAYDVDAVLTQLPYSVFVPKPDKADEEDDETMVDEDQNQPLIPVIRFTLAIDGSDQSKTLEKDEDVKLIESLKKLELKRANAPKRRDPPSKVQHTNPAQRGSEPPGHVSSGTTAAPPRAPSVAASSGQPNNVTPPSARAAGKPVVETPVQNETPHLPGVEMSEKKSTPSVQSPVKAAVPAPVPRSAAALQYGTPHENFIQRREEDKPFLRNKIRMVNEAGRKGALHRAEKVKAKRAEATIQLQGLKIWNEAYGDIPESVEMFHIQLNALPDKERTICRQALTKDYEEIYEKYAASISDDEAVSINEAIDMVRLDIAERKSMVGDGDL